MRCRIHLLAPYGVALLVACAAFAPTAFAVCQTASITSSWSEARSDKNAAISNAIDRWQREVSSSKGVSFGLWASARERRFGCTRNRTANWQCNAVAAPCDAAAPPDSADERQRDTQSVLAVTLVGQETDEWCWAASAQMTVAYAGVSIRQCEQANAFFNRTDCCTAPNSRNCRRPGWPDYGRLGFKGKTTDWYKHLSFNKIKAEIDAGRPINFAWEWTKNEEGGHMMVLSGYQEGLGLRMVQVHNPLPVRKGAVKWLAYDEFISSDTYTHFRDYYEIMRANTPVASGTPR